MTANDGSPTIAAGLQRLKRFTPARIALGRAGSGQTTQDNLSFALDHARARDAVHAALDAAQIARDLKARGWDVVSVHSAARDRAEYLRRPDLGRRLAPQDRAALEADARLSDVVIVAADGLSALALNAGLSVLLDRLRPQGASDRVARAPVVLVEQGRVAIGDAIAELMGAKLVVVLIGERPGLSAADSMGAYITWRPRVGTQDSGRNCVSNIRPGGLSFEDAAAQIGELVQAAFAHGMTGVRLNDLRSGAAAAIESEKR